MNSIKLFLGFATSMVFVILMTGFVLIYPINSVFTHENTKETFHNINLYDRIVNIVAKQWLKFSPLPNSDDQYFETLIRDHATEIVSSEWVGVLGDQFIDEVFYSLKYDDAFSNFIIDLRPVKSNFVNVLANSDIKNDAFKIKSQIPDDINVTLLLGVDLNQINFVIRQFNEIFKMFAVLKIILGCLTILPVIVLFLLFSFKKAVTWFMGSLLVTSIPFLIFPFVFKFIILSKSGLTLMTSHFSSFREIIAILAGLSFIEQMMHTWTIFGLIFFGLSSVYMVWFLVYGRIR